VRLAWPDAADFGSSRPTEPSNAAVNDPPSVQIRLAVCCFSETVFQSAERIDANVNEGIVRIRQESRGYQQ